MWSAYENELPCIQPQVPFEPPRMSLDLTRLSRAVCAWAGAVLALGCVAFGFICKALWNFVQCARACLAHSKTGVPAPPMVQVSAAVASSLGQQPNFLQGDLFGRPAPYQFDYIRKLSIVAEIPIADGEPQHVLRVSV